MTSNDILETFMKDSDYEFLTRGWSSESEWTLKKSLCLNPEGGSGRLNP